MRLLCTIFVKPQASTNTKGKIVRSKIVFPYDYLFMYMTFDNNTVIKKKNIDISISINVNNYFICHILIQCFKILRNI